MVNKPRKTGPHLLNAANPLWGFLVLGVALGVRFVWLLIFQDRVGHDAVRYLWISEHVTRGRWDLLPQLYTSPLFPAAVGVISMVSGDNLWTARILGILGNTLAVGIAMLLVRSILPERPALAWLTGLGLAVNHVWARYSVFAFTDNFFYPLLLGLFLLMLKLREEITWARGLIFGALWGLAYLSKDVGLYCGAVIFLWLAGATLWHKESWPARFSALGRLSIPAFLALFLLMAPWVYWYSQVWGKFSIGEGPRFYSEITRLVDRGKKRGSMRYENGGVAFFHLRPYEMMEYTRFPQPGDERYPPATLRVFSNPWATLKNIGLNLIWAFREFKRTNLVGFLTLFIIIPVGILLGKIRLNPATLFLWGAFWGVIALHTLGRLNEARVVGWFFPWLYLGLAAFTCWLWQQLRSRPSLHPFIVPGSLLIVALFAFHLLYPQYFREVPRRWQERCLPHIEELAAAHIAKEFGPGALISTAALPGVAYRSKGYWLAQPEGDAAGVVEWLYLGKADYLVLHNIFPPMEKEKILWAAPATLKKVYPELELVAEFLDVPNKNYGSRGRVFRFHPDPEKFARYQRQYPWAGTHPREALATRLHPAN